MRLAGKFAGKFAGMFAGENGKIARLGANVNQFITWFNTYVLRVETDSGVIQSTPETKSIYQHLQENGTYDDTLLLLDAEAGLKIRESGVLKYVPKAYDLSGVATPNDATQTTEASQPRLRGFIPPNEKQAFANLKGESRYFSHPAISFAANEAWSLTGLLNWDGANSGILFSGGTNTQLEIDATGKLKFTNESAASDTTTNAIYEYIGKNTVVHLIADGAGSIEIKLNDVLFDTLSVANNANFAGIFDGTTGFTGTLFNMMLFNGEKTSVQITSEYTFLRNRVAEIETVQIGTQDWATSNFEAVATPLGNVIQEMQSSVAVEKVTGGDFESGLIGTLTSGDETATWTLNTTTPISGTQDGLLQVTSAGTTLNRPHISIPVSINAGTWVKVSFDYKVNSGTCIYRSTYAGGGLLELDLVTLVGTGTYTEYLQSVGTSSYLFVFEGRNSFNVQIDNVSVEQLGWADSQELYDGLIAQGSPVQTALEASAMWCYYNNDVNLGATYGKLYNWFAAKLLQTDIDTYNASNPDWGWHVPTSTEFTTLQTYLGGSTVAGGKMKVAGTDYWNTPNTGADNSSGFSALGGGRNAFDEFSLVGRFGYYWTINNYSFYTVNNSITLLNIDYSSNKQLGFSLRLLKD